TGVLAVLLALVTIAALYWASLAQRPKGSDLEQLHMVMVQGERALEERHISEAMAFVSNEYHDSQGRRRATLGALVGRQLREAQTLDINVPARMLHIDVVPGGNRATVRAHVDVHAASRFETVFNQGADVTLEFVKEPVRYYLLFPGEEW